MSVNVEKLEKNMAKLTVTIPAADIEAAKERVFDRQKKQIALPGFRKGKASRQMVEKVYGKAVFFEDAVNECVPVAYEAAAEESGLEITSFPEIAFEKVALGEDVVFTAVVAVRPEVTLGEYKGLKVDAEEVSVSEEDIEEELKKLQKTNSTEEEVTDRPVADGDRINLDFEGFVDGVAFDGGKGENYPLTIGSGSFIPGFEEQLIGVEIGAEVAVKVTFPEDYSAANLAGKEAVFNCKVNGIKTDVLPELDDEFASNYSEFETLDELKASLRTQVLDRKEAAAKTKKEDQLVEMAVENAQMDIPQPMIDSEAQRMTEEFEQRLQYQGLNMEMYCQYTGQTVEQMLEANKPEAEKRIRTRLVLEEIAKAENIEVSDDDLEAEMSRIAQSYGMELDQVKSTLTAQDKENMKLNLSVQKAVDVLYNTAL